MPYDNIKKATENQGFTVSLEDTFFEKPQGAQIDTPLPPTPPPSCFRFKYYYLCGRVKKSKAINSLYIKLVVKNSDITKLANFNTAESNILTTKYFI